MINTETNKKDAFIARIEALGAPAQPGSTHFDVPVTTGSDDAEEKASGTVNLASTTLELVTDTSVQKVGVRFAGLDIPAGAIIQNAWIQFTANRFWQQEFDPHTGIPVMSPSRRPSRPPSRKILAVRTAGGLAARTGLE